MTLKRAGLAALLALAFVPAASADEAVSIGDLAKNPDAYVGKRIVAEDCLMMSANTIVGAQCSVVPMDPSLLVYVDADTWDAAAGTLAMECNTADIMNMCLLKVTGDVAKDGRGQALVKNARLELVKRVPSF